MLERLRHRRPRELLLDAVFFVWLGYVAFTGSLVPAPLLSLLRNDPPAVVISEPAVDPGSPEIEHIVIPET